MTHAHTTHILIVEDYPNLQFLYRSALEARGYKVVVAQNGEEALVKAKEHEPDLILLDLLMPLQGGLEFLRAYDTKQHPQVKVVVFSNMISPELFDEAKKLGALQYLTKTNYTPKELVGAIEAVLGAKVETTAE